MDDRYGGRNGRRWMGREGVRVGWEMGVDVEGGSVKV